VLFKLDQESEHCDKLLVTVSWIWHTSCVVVVWLHSAQDRMLALYVMTVVISVPESYYMQSTHPFSRQNC